MYIKKKKYVYIYIKKKKTFFKVNVYKSFFWDRFVFE
jgi:hypothetical protein